MGAISLYAKASGDFAQKLAASKQLLQTAGASHSPLTQASSLGAEDMVVTHLIAETGIDASVFVLDTGMLHPQTLALVGKIEARYGRTVDLYQPDADIAADFVTEYGADAMYKSLALRKACCDFRKMMPLERALAGKKGWITGLRREQSNARADVHDIEQQSLQIDGQTVLRSKINPLAAWTLGDVWHFIALHKIPYNTLHDEFFPSIGCAPCTRAVTLGEDFRSGRWWWEQESAKECGLHVAGEASFAHAAEEVPAFEPVPRFSAISSIPIKEIVP